VAYFCPGAHTSKKKPRESLAGYPKHKLSWPFFPRVSFSTSQRDFSKTKIDLARVKHKAKNHAH
jgi:hypothetical protein